MKACKDKMTAMAIKHRMKRNTTYRIDSENIRTMPTVTRYHIKLLCTTYADSDATLADSSTKSSAEANEA